MLTRSQGEGATARPVAHPSLAPQPAIKLGLARPAVAGPTCVGGAR